MLIALLAAGALAGEPTACVVRHAELYTSEGRVWVGAGALVELVRHGKGYEITDPEFGEGAWLHRVRWGEHTGVMSSADLALPIRSAHRDFGFADAGSWRFDFDGDGVEEHVWIGVTETVEATVAPAPLRHNQAWLVVTDGEDRTAVSIAEWNAWGTTATLKAVDRQDVTGDSAPELLFWFARTVKEVGEAPDDLVVAGMFGGRVRTLLELSVGNPVEHGARQYHFGAVEVREDRVVHDEVRIPKFGCPGPGDCLYRTKTHWVWSDDRGAFEAWTSEAPVLATADGPLEVTERPGSRRARVVDWHHDHLEVFQVSDGHLLVRTPDGELGWVAASEVQLDAPYLEPRLR